MDGTTPQTITLSQLQHLYVLGFISTSPDTDTLNYMIQVKKAYTTDDTHNITVTVSSFLICKAYQAMTEQREGITSDYNNAIKAALIPQVTNPWLGEQIGIIQNDNVTRRDGIVTASRNLITAITL